MTTDPQPETPPPTRRRPAGHTWRATPDTWLLIACLVLLVLIVLGVGVTSGDVW